MHARAAVAHWLARNLVTRFDVEAFGDAWTAAKTRQVVKPVVVVGR